MRVRRTSEREREREKERDWAIAEFMIESSQRWKASV